MTRRTAGGFTLLEALAAVATLGLLAIAVVPLLRQLGTISLADRMQAQSYLKTLVLPEDLTTTSVLSVPEHPGWSLVVSELYAEAEPPPPSGHLPPSGPPHHWLLVGIHASGGETLAETTVAVFDPGVQP